MQELFLKFIDTLDVSLKTAQMEAGERTGFSKLTVSQLQYVDAVHALGEPTLSELAAKLNITKASVTTGVKKLVRSGYAIKTQSSTDKRIYHVSLTTAGKQLVAAKGQAIRSYEAFVRAALNEDELQRFEDTLAKLVRLFEEKNQNDPARR
jgi:DNA-binding MarR family transcriptional regulator